MRRTASFITILSAALFAAVPLRTCWRADLAQAAPPSQATAHLGEVNFDTSCTAEANASIQTAVALLHSFQYAESRQTFSQATRQDPKCAIAHWGLAMSRYEQLWEFPNKHVLKDGLDDVQQAQKLAAASAVHHSAAKSAVGATASSDKDPQGITAPGAQIPSSKEASVKDQERGYIAAAAAFYRDNSKLTHEQRMHAYSSALDQLRKKFPDDVNAAAFYALSLVALSEEEDGADKKKADTREAISILQPLCEQAPNNPGPAHYLIHATDSPEFASQGLAAARSYAHIAPDSAHALHMPSHIFVRLGLWQESIDSNIAAAAAAEKAINEHRGEAHYQFHALDFLHYSYLQSGQEAKAREVLAALKNVPGADKEATNDHLGYMTARTALELHRWKEAAALSIPDVRPTDRETTYRVRVIGAARSGDPASARKDLQTYEELRAQQRKRSSEEGYKATRDKSAAELEAEAWVQYAEGKSDEAAKTMRAAAEKQDAGDLDSLAIPAREMLADLLLELKRPGEAFTEYQAALTKSPNRFDSLYGAAHSAQLAGDSASARTYFAKLMEVCSPSADRAELADAKSFLTAAAKAQ